MAQKRILGLACLVAGLAVVACGGADDSVPDGDTETGGARTGTPDANTSSDPDGGVAPSGSGGSDTGEGSDGSGNTAPTSLPVPGAGGTTAAGGSSSAMGGMSTGLGGFMSTGGMSSATGGMTPGTGGSGAAYANAGGASSGAPEPATGGSGDSFESPGTNPFVLVGHDPLSTFAADTDTASYDIFRRDIEDGVLPDPDSVRLEEYVNFFEYDYPAPDAGSSVPFSVHLAAAPHILQRDTLLFRVGIQGQAAPPSTEQPPANLVFLVDVSGSMSASDKLPIAQYLLRQSLEVLAPTDTVSIVTYSDVVEVALGPTQAGDVDTILPVVDSLAASGSTAGAAAMEVAYEQAQAGFIEGGMNHVVMCTDGDFNVGVSSTDALVEMIEEKRETGITLTVLGFGSGNLNDSMMEAISNKGDGVYGHISSIEIADEYVHERLLSNMYFIAKDMKIQVEFNPDHVYAYRLLGYENRAVADTSFRDDTIDGGEVGAGHQVTALYELVPVGTEVPAPEGAPAPTDGDAYAGTVEIRPSDLALVKIRYKDRTATVEDPAREVAATLAPDAVAATEGDLDASFQWALAMATYAEILKHSPYADPSQLDLLGRMFARPVHESFDDRVEFVNLFEEARSFAE